MDFALAFSLGGPVARGASGPPIPTVTVTASISADASPDEQYDLPALPAGLYYVPGLYAGPFEIAVTILSQTRFTIDLAAAFAALGSGSSFLLTFTVPTTTVEPVAPAVLTEAGSAILTEAGSPLLKEAA